ncbi:DUF4214 domain-containing protein [Motiliproteus sp. MSK22-1]|uniref:DUF4214 domain-containing protein n=1 Tax=Motiliproteus sp. MSK22-1 TaxID=1897630 RepID=UPI0009760464|nr:DUF4214 domain-containing protein [Motiliproteus sp. MSK22-1]OMH31708.1 hypothetical protein BGP75_16425 [Motiliproteus sp. MSK22-1]
MSTLIRLVFGIFCLISASVVSIAEARDFSDNDIQVIEAYIAYYGRAPDVEGLNYWSQRLNDENGNLQAIIEAFGNSNEFETRYGRLTSSELVTNLYQQLFNRDPEEDGLLFYEQLLETQQRTLQSIAVDILNGASGTDENIVNNRVTVSQYILEALEVENKNSLEGSENVLATVDTTSSSINAAKEQVDDIIAGILIFLEYDHNIAPDQLTDVEMVVEGIDSSNLIPANQIAHGYTTWVIDNNTSYTVTPSTDTSSLIVTGVGAPAFAIGDIIVGVTPDNETGFIRKVINIEEATEEESEELTLTTELASIQAAYPDALLNLSISLFNESGSQNDETSRLHFDSHLEHQLDASITTVADISMDAAFDLSLDLNVSGATVSQMNAVATSDYKTEAYLAVDAPYDYSRQFNKTFAPIVDETTVLTISDIPLLLNVKVIPVIGASVGMSAEGQLQYGYRVDGPAQAGFNYDTSIFTPITSFSPVTDYVTPEYTVTGGGYGETEVSLAVFISLYEAEVEIPAVGTFKIEGPGIGINLSHNAQFDINATYDGTADPKMTCQINLSAGSSSELAIDDVLAQSLSLSNSEAVELHESFDPVWSTTDCPFNEMVGHLDGTAIKEDGSGLYRVQVDINTPAGTTVKQTTTDLFGKFSTPDLAPGAYDVSFTKNFYEPASYRIEILPNVTKTLPNVLIMLAQDEGAIGTIKLTVADAQDPTNILSDVSFLIREGLNNPAGDYVDFITSTDGETGITDLVLPAGHYTLEVSKQGYTTVYESFSVVGDQVIEEFIYLSSLSSDGAARVVLTWGEDPDDLDSHLLADSEHVYFASPTAPGINLDVDDVTSFGPETISIDEVSTSTDYTYYVHHFSGNGSIATSDATVTLYYNGRIHTINAPAGSGRYWRVFDILNGDIVFCSTDCITSVEPGTEDQAQNNRQKRKPYRADQWFD